ncbi:MAG: hypothetical protein FWG91_07435 [Lachnospiraceae bacterium]|nr:hypothetical protein [Lachnospiraceae bacterium]
MKRRAIKLAAFVLMGMFLIIQSFPAHAKAPPNLSQATNAYMPIMPLSDNVNSISLTISNSSGKAACSGAIFAATGTTSIKATFKLEKKVGSSWSHEKTWTKDSTSSVLTFSDSSHSISAGSTYRLTLTAVVVRNGKSETVSASTESVL